jgi:biopolymer transport protein ExbD
MALGQLPEARDYDEEGEAIFADINITPLTDLFLVMLIIFMVSASAAVDKAEQEREKVQKTVETEKRSGLKVNLPSGAAQEIDPTTKSLIVSIAANGELSINGQKVASADVDRVFESAFAENKNTQVIIKADKGVHHGRVVSIMERAKRVGLTRLAIATRGGGK